MLVLSALIGIEVSTAFGAFSANCFSQVILFVSLEESPPTLVGTYQPPSACLYLTKSGSEIRLFESHPVYFVAISPTLHFCLKT